MGGTGRSLDRHELEALERIAKDTFRQGIAPHRRNVFISFASEDLTLVQFLRGQAKNEYSNLEFSDRSLTSPFDSDSAEYIKRGIRERMRQASVTLVFVTENTSQSKWVEWEIKESINLGKGVVAMYQGDRPPSNLPSSIRELRIELVPWSHAEIMSAIDRAAESRT